MTDHGTSESDLAQPRALYEIYDDEALLEVNPDDLSYPAQEALEHQLQTHNLRRAAPEAAEQTPSAPVSVSADSENQMNRWSHETCGNQWAEDPISTTSSQKNVRYVEGEVTSPVLDRNAVHMEQVRAKRRLRQNRFITFVGIAAILLVCVAGWSLPWTPVRFLGLALLWLSGVFWSIARWQLGPSLTARPEAHKLVTHGVYAYLQNPIYLFGMLTTIGMLLFLNLPVVALLAAMVLTPIQIRRVRKERTVLTAAFGDEYGHYRKRTWF